MVQINTFSKSEHLCGEKRINRLFTDGKAFITYPLRVVYLIEPKTDVETASVLVSVPKKKFKRAVKRNKIKRLMRETYRLNKQEIYQKLVDNNLQIHIAFNYVSDEMPNFETLEKRMKVSLEKIIERIELYDI